MNTRPFISPTSTRRALPAAITRAASSISVGMPRSRAKWLSVPSGRMPSAVPVPASADAAAAMVPSPPPAINKGSPRSAMALARTSQSPPSIGSIAASTPAAASADATRSAIFGLAAAVPPRRLRRTTAPISAVNRSIGRTDPEGGDLVAVGIAEIGAVEGLRALVAADPGRALVAPTELDRLGVERVDVGAAGAGDRRHVSVAGGRAVAVIGLAHGEPRPVHRRAVHGEIVAELHDPAGADHRHQRIVDSARPGEVIAAEGYVADHWRPPLTCSPS